MDVKKKWWERSALVATARTKDKQGSEPALDQAEGRPGREAEGDRRGSDERSKPGAVAVRGPGYEEGSNEDNASAAPRGQGGGIGGEADDENTDLPPLHVDSYAVHDPSPLPASDEEVRRQILTNTPHAEPVAVDETKGTRGSRSATWLWVAAAFAIIFAAIAVGVAVPLAARSQQSLRGPDKDVVASITYLERQGSGGFAMGLNAQTRQNNPVDGATVTSGMVEMIKCKPSACLESDESCVVDKFYSSGCCAGAECPNETKCGEFCPVPPESCHLTDPNNRTCVRSACYTCNQTNEGDTYTLRDFVFSIDCLEVGTAIRPENGQLYKWAIFCGPVILGPVVNENKDLGEYQCGAARLGANFSDDSGGLMVGFYPCQYIALGECGCGPSDMYTFGLPAPTGPCLPNGGCPLLCEDAGTMYARNLCHSFPGNISWWEGKNAFNTSWFIEGQMAPDYVYEIYIRGIDI
jgi:hypothetical protein